jgi:phosphohistidine swiveling domain-containing protein
LFRCSRRGKLVARTGGASPPRSSALVEDRHGSSFAGSSKATGLEAESDSHRRPRVLGRTVVHAGARYGHARSGSGRHRDGRADQPLVRTASGGGLNRTASGECSSSVGTRPPSRKARSPRRCEISQGGCCASPSGRKIRGRLLASPGAVDGGVSQARAAEPCLDEARVLQIGGLLRRAEEIAGAPVEIEWALDEDESVGVRMLQARPLHLQAAHVPDEVWLQHPRLSGHPAGVGWGAGRAVVINCECEIGRVAPGDVLVTRVGGPALSHILPRVAGVVTERGGSTSHMASLARERGVPMVLGVADATRRIPDGAQVAVDGVAGIVRWMR